MSTTKIFEEGTFTTTGAHLSQPDFTTVIVENDAFITQSAQNWGMLLDPGSWTVTVNGVIEAPQNGIRLLSSDSTKNSKITIGTEGYVWGQNRGEDGIHAFQAIDVTNSGTIEGGSIGIFIDAAVVSGKGSTIINKAGAVIVADAPNGAGIFSENADLFLTVKNAGTIIGPGSGIEWAHGANITNTGSIGDLIASNAADTMANTITNGGSVGGITLSNANDTVKNTGHILGGVSLLEGKNTLTNSGTVDLGISGGNGIDSITNSGTVQDSIGLGGGANIFKNSGVVARDVIGNAGADTFTNSGHIYGSVDLGFGDNKVTNSGTIEGDVTLADGKQSVINSGAINGDLSIGNGDGKITSSGFVYSIAVGTGDHTITNSGVVYTSVTSGSGNDVFNNSGTVNGTIDLGGGDDKFTGGSHADYVLDNFGNDTYSLGGGNDTFVSLGLDHFKLDGGAGRDVFVAQVPYAIDLSKGTAIDTADIGGYGGTIKGFEELDGSNGADVFTGSAAAETLLGNGGVDVLVGGLGADHLDGGADGDVYLYQSTKDSGATKATRDVIETFDGDGAIFGDLIDLAGVDANSKSAGPQHFAWHGEDYVFTKTAGELREVFVGLDTIIEGDTNGDGKTDFSIQVAGIHHFTEIDFLL
jgi:hypothetical protein